ncbi:serine hydrolase domain-containing protein [Candidatus Latescibacterota bacterium]
MLKKYLIKGTVLFIAVIAIIIAGCNDKYLTPQKKKEKPIKSNLDEIVSNVTTKKYIYGAVFHISTGDNSIDLKSASGNINEDSQYYIASINKLFISAIILKLDTENKLDLDDKISKYLPEELVNELHVYKGRDYSNDITISHLMSHTSGLPCYLTDKQADGKKAMDDFEAGIDQAWPIEKVIHEVKRMKTHFPPGKKGKAKYSDTNYQILSLIIENITRKPINIVLNNMFQELNLTNTYVYEDVKENNFVPIRYKSDEIYLPQFFKSTKNDIISTAQDQMIFIRAFFGGNIFPKEKLKELEKWNNIFFPFKYGVGIQKFYMPRILSPFQAVPDMVGHCGSTGSVAFYVPDKDIYITGTINQQAKPNVAFQAIIKIINEIE